jgi:hypothetical protein
MTTERAEIARLFRWNSALRHGVPIVDMLRGVRGTNDARRSSVEASEHVSDEEQSHNSSPNALQDRDRSFISRAAPWALAAASLLGGGGLGLAGYMLGSDAPQQSTVQQVPVKQHMDESSLLQYLEDEGLHRWEER